MARILRQIGFAFKCFFLVLFAGHLPDELPEEFLGEARTSRGFPPQKGVAADEARPVTGADPAGGQRAGQTEIEIGRAVQLLALLQRDGRLVDFLFEDLSGYPDDQVGAAAREVHGSCRTVLQRYLGLEPVVASDEGRPTTVEPGFDPGAIKLVGEVAGQPPFRGVLRHRGWRVTRVSLPSLPDDANRSVVAPAEVEIG